MTTSWNSHQCQPTVQGRGRARARGTAREGVHGGKGKGKRKGKRKRKRRKEIRRTMRQKQVAHLLLLLAQVEQHLGMNLEVPDS